MQVMELGATQLAVVRPASGGFPRHSHDEYVISANLTGRERVRLDRSSFDVDLDEVTVYNPGQVQSCTTRTPAGTPFACVSWYVPPSAVLALTGGRPLTFDRPAVRAPHLRATLLTTARLALPRPPKADLALAKERLASAGEGLVPSEARLALAEGRLVPSEERLAPSGARLALAEERLASSEERLAPAEEPLTLAEERLALAEERLVPSEERLALAEERLVLLLLRLADLVGSRPGSGGPAQGDVPMAPGDVRMVALLDRLRGDLTVAPNLAELAREAGMSREHLVRSFTRATGCPPYAWHLQARLAEGRRLLRRGRPVADVAHALGFADQAHFHRHFTAAYAITPGRYRRQINI